MEKRLYTALNKAFAGSSVYQAEDMPEIDCLLISHDHWDHLDYPTVTALRTKVKQVICPLGLGAYFQDWNYPKDTIDEGDWGDSIALGKDMLVHVIPARYYSGRLFKENKTLWAGFVIQTPDLRIFYSGDSGYGPHFANIGKTFNGFDLVLLDCGQYDSRWAYIHMTPEEAAQAAQDLAARTLIPAHGAASPLPIILGTSPSTAWQRQAKIHPTGCLRPESGSRWHWRTRPRLF